MRKLKEKIKLENRNVLMGQYGPEEKDWNYNFEQMEGKEDKYAKSIGSLMLSFSYLENSLNNNLATSINERSHEPGYRIIKYLNFKTKIGILNDDYIFFIKIMLNSKKIKEKLLEQNKVIYTKLQELSQFRNKIAHADWTTLDKKGFVVTKIVEDEKQGGMYFKKTKMTPGVIIKFTRQNYAISNKLSLFRDKVWDANNREEVITYRKTHSK